MIFFSLIATAGFAIFIASFVNHTRYGSLFLLVPGSFGNGPPLGTWVANNTAPLARRAVALAFAITMTNVGGIFATWLFGVASPAPEYRAATATLLGFQIATAVCAGANVVWLKRENGRKRRMREEVLVRVEERDIRTEGDESIWYEYVL